MLVSWENISPLYALNSPGEIATTFRLLMHRLFTDLFSSIPRFLEPTSILSHPNKGLRNIISSFWLKPLLVLSCLDPQATQHLLFLCVWLWLPSLMPAYSKAPMYQDSQDILFLLGILIYSWNVIPFPGFPDITPHYIPLPLLAKVICANPPMIFLFEVSLVDGKWLLKLIRIVCHFVSCPGEKICLYIKGLVKYFKASMNCTTFLGFRAHSL